MPIKPMVQLEKEIAAKKAVEFIKSEMIVGLGSGSTVELALKELAKKVRDGLVIHAIPSSLKTERIANELGIPIINFSNNSGIIDVTIDGADEVDQNNILIKGGGGALLREKVIAYFSKIVIIMVDSKKLVTKIGKFPLPIEVIPFSYLPVMKEITRLYNVPAVLRTIDGNPFVSDNGNYILDCKFELIDDPDHLEQSLKKVPGVAETGIFSNYADIVIFGRNERAEVMYTKRNKRENYLKK